MLIFVFNLEHLNSIKKLLNGFFQRSGSIIFAAIVIARISNFLAYLIALRFIVKEELGVVIYTFSFVSFLIPMAGLGVQQSLVRYGALLKQKAQIEGLFMYVLKKGFWITIGLVSILLFLSSYYPFKYEKSSFYFKILIFSVLFHFLMALVKIYLRLHYKNKMYAYLEITYSFLFVGLVSVLSYFYSEIGYIIAIITTPLLTFLIFIFKMNVNFKKKERFNFINFEFWKYGFFAGLANVVPLFLFEIDTILIGNLLENPIENTYYKYITLIPFSLLFLPNVLMATDFVYFTERISNRKYILNYIKSYILIFSGVSFLLLIGAYFLGKIGLVFLFGKEYGNFIDTFLILMVGISGILILRTLFGNLLSSIGKASANFYIGLLALLVNVISNYYFIPKYGIKGAAITSAIIMWFTSILSLLLFFYYYSKTKTNL